MSSRNLSTIIVTGALCFLCSNTAIPRGNHNPSRSVSRPANSVRSTIPETKAKPGPRYSGPLYQGPGENAFSTDLHVHGSFSEGNASMHSTTEEVDNVGLDVIWWSDHDGFFTHYHMISSYSFEGWVEPASTHEIWVPNTTGEVNQSKSFVIESLDPMEYDDAQITPDEAYEGFSSLKLSCSSSSSTPEAMLYKFNADTKRNKRALGAEVSVGLAVFPTRVTTNATGVIEIILSLHESVSSSGWEQYKLKYFLHPDPQLPRSRNGAVYNIPVTFTEGQWNLLSLPISADAIEGFSWLTGIDNSLFQLNIGVESSFGDTAIVFFDDLQFTTTLAGNEVLDVHRAIMDSLEARRPNVFQLQSVETHWKHMNILGETFELPNYDSIAVAGGFMDSNGWIANQAAFEDYCARAVVNQAHARGNVVSYNHMFGASTNSTGGPDPQETLDNLIAAGVYGVDLLEVGYVARGGQNLDAHLWVWDELAKQDLYLVGVGVTDAHGLFPGDWATRANRMISWIYSDEPTSVSLVEGLKRGRVYFGDLLLFDGTVDLTTSHGFMMGQQLLTDRTDEDVAISIDGLAAGDLVKTYWDGALTNTYVANGPIFYQTENRQLGSANTFMRVAVTSAAGANKAFSNPIYFLRQIPEGGIASPRAGFDIGDIHSTTIVDFTVTNVTTDLTTQKSIFTIEGTGNNGVIVLNIANTVTPDSVRFETINGSWELIDTLLVLSGLNGTGLIEISGGSPPFVTDIPDQTILHGENFSSIMLDDYVEDVWYPDSLLDWSVSGDSVLSVSISDSRVASIIVENPQWTGTEGVAFHVTNPDGFSSSQSVLFTILSDTTGIPCGAIFQFQTRCTPTGKILMRITLRNSTEYAGEVVSFGVDSVALNTILVTNGVHSKAQTSLRGMAPGNHVVTLLVPNGCFDPVTVTCGSGAGREDELWWNDAAGFELEGGLMLEEIPEQTELQENYPNPFNPTTNIRFALSEGSHVELRIYDILGQPVKTLVEEFLPAGYHSATWHGDSDFGNGVSSGVYLYVMKGSNDHGTFFYTKKLVLVR